MRIKESSFTIVTNGFADGPAQPLRDYLLKRHAKQLTMVSHPLVAEGSNKHLVATYRQGRLIHQKAYAMPNRPPYTFALDTFVPLRVPPSDAWFAFNNLAALKGLGQRRRSKTGKVYYWAVDFVPNRFGNSILTGIYNRIDRKVCKQVDARIELSQTALEARAKYLKLKPEAMAPSLVVPMGTWLSRTPKANSTAWRKRSIVYMGHLVKRQGVRTLIQALDLLNRQRVEFQADIIGSGPEEQGLRQLAKKLHLTDRVTFHGFVEDYQAIEYLLGNASIAAAPYAKTADNFTQFADPGKLKAYLGAGLPMVLTAVPPNASELESAGVARLADDSPETFAQALQFFMDRPSWQKAHQAALVYAKQFDWDYILNRALSELGFN